MGAQSNMGQRIHLGLFPGPGRPRACMPGPGAGLYPAPPLAGRSTSSLAGGRLQCFARHRPLTAWDTVHPPRCMSPPLAISASIRARLLCTGTGAGKPEAAGWGSEGSWQEGRGQSPGGSHSDRQVSDQKQGWGSGMPPHCPGSHRGHCPGVRTATAGVPELGPSCFIVVKRGP